MANRIKGITVESGGDTQKLQTALKGVNTELPVKALFIGLSAAVIDESIQIFDNHGSQVQDVLLDFTGCCAGRMLAGLIVWMIGADRRYHSKDSKLSKT